MAKTWSLNINNSTKTDSVVLGVHSDFTDSFQLLVDTNKNLIQCVAVEKMMIL
jgi:hypothetical protein